MYHIDELCFPDEPQGSGDFDLARVQSTGLTTTTYQYAYGNASERGVHAMIRSDKHRPC